MWNFNHGFDHPVGRVEPMFKFGAHFVKHDPMGDVSSWVDFFLLQIGDHLFKILSGGIAATHQRPFTLVEFRMAKGNFAFL